MARLSSFQQTLKWTSSNPSGQDGLAKKLDSKCIFAISVVDRHFPRTAASRVWST
ncbi:hypothetical protein K443DRAFT_680238 [Laccaria amethystina LaAM-08-1]|uniref:Uncharacterized protein n=1 Tax=Laccaria amethystina LaAM-08-1 TaxID=1095629 RepID=A0A0C9XNH2_9AGAR|nr:hypothetical protein K443DRAFT_680238 [Laccaria amethystina LaAM-08-1]